MQNETISPSDILASLFSSAISAAYPNIDKMPLPDPVVGRTLVVGAGKAAASMAAVVDENWNGGELEGLVVTRYAHGLDLNRIQVVEAGHPVPDEAGQKAAAQILQKVKELGEDDQLIVLISGGGSSLLSLPAEGVSCRVKKQLIQLC